MEQIDYACGINCPEGISDEQMLMDFVIDNDCELCYLDAYLKDTFNRHKNQGNSDSGI